MSNLESLSPLKTRRTQRVGITAAPGGRPYISLFLYSLLITHCASASTGIVQTLGNRHSGNIHLSDQHIRIDNKTIAWSSTLYVLLNIDRQTVNADEVLWLKNGERWNVNVTGMTAKGLTIRSRITGRRTLKPDLIHRIDFLPDVDIQQPEAETLYRPNAEAVPGTLLWLDRTHLAIDSPLGVAKTRRDKASSYVISYMEGKALKDVSRIGLIDGSVFAGSLKFGKKAVSLSHKILGELPIPYAAIRSIKPANTNIQFLTDLQPEQTESTSPLNTPLDSAAPVRSKGSANSITQHLNHLRIPSGTTLHYMLPSNKKHKFHAHLSPTPQGDPHLIVTVDSKVVFNKTVQPKPVRLVLDIPAGNRLSLRTQIGKRLHFPSSITIADPILIRQ
ncbi:MAG: hypothetical protein QF473_17235 [Planctomycetota bacterium]|nr:hypothetical protein [Planctomycetota bacterium]